MFRWIETYADRQTPREIDYYEQLPTELLDSFL